MKNKKRKNHCFYYLVLRTHSFTVFLSWILWVKANVSHIKRYTKRNVQCVATCEHGWNASEQCLSGNASRKQFTFCIYAIQKNWLKIIWCICKIENCNENVLTLFTFHHFESMLQIINYIGRRLIRIVRHGVIWLYLCQQLVFPHFLWVCMFISKCNFFSRTTFV